VAHPYIVFPYGILSGISEKADDLKIGTVILKSTGSSQGHYYFGRTIKISGFSPNEGVLLSTEVFLPKSGFAVFFSSCYNPFPKKALFPFSCEEKKAENLQVA
jgi:hypothetical protein